MYSVPPAYNTPGTSSQSMTLSQIIEETFRRYKQNFATFATISLLLALPGLLLSLYMTVTVLTDLPIQLKNLEGMLQRQEINDPNQLFALMQPIITMGLLAIAIGAVDFLVFRPLAVAATAYAVRDMYSQQVSVGAAIGAAVSRFLPLLAWGVIFGLVLWAPLLLIGASTGAMIINENLGLVLFCLLLPLWPVLSIFLAIKMIFGSRVIALEHCGVVGAWRRSWALSTGSFWRILGFTCVLLVIAFVIQMLIGFLIQLVLSLLMLDPLSVTVNIITTISSGIIGALLAPIVYIGMTLLYYDVRRKQEWTETTPAVGTTQGSL